MRKLYEAFVALGVGRDVSLEELREAMGARPGEHNQLRRRIEELRRLGFDCERTGQRGRLHLYCLKHADPVRLPSGADEISEKARAAVIYNARGRCQMCGRTIERDGITLQADHRIPRSWGMGSDLDNLWAICAECNRGKKNFFATIEDGAKKCMTYPETIQRLGELLKLFAGRPAPPRWLLETVAMDDEWTRRIRELRDLGWEYRTVRIKKTNGRWSVSYSLISSREWPADIQAAIQEAAAKRGSKSYGA